MALGAWAASDTELPAGNLDRASAPLLPFGCIMPLWTEKCGLCLTQFTKNLSISSLYAIKGFGNVSTVGTWVSVIGSIASIAGAVWAFVEARKSSRAATKAEKVKDEIVSRRKLIEVSQVHVETKRILSRVSTVGPACNPSLLRGITGSSIAKDVEEYSRYLNEHSSHFDDFFHNKAKELCQNLRPDIEALSEAESGDDIKSFGTSIYYKINGFMPLAKKLSDERKENVSIS